MGFTDAIRTCFRKYVTFSGRASRPEYWYFVLFVLLGGFATGFLDAVIFPDSVEVSAEATETSASVEVQNTGPLTALFSLATFVPMLAAGWRRMHDSGRSGLHVIYPLLVFIGIGTFASFGFGLAEATGGPDNPFNTVVGIILIPALIIAFISPLLVLWWLTRPSTPGPNAYGPHPLGLNPNEETS